MENKKKRFNLLQILLIVGILFIYTRQVCAQLVENPIQKNVAIKFMYYLERKLPDSAFLLIAPQNVRNNEHLKEDLEAAVKDIESIIKQTYPSIILVKNKNGKFYRCRYYNPKEKYPDFYQADIYFVDDKEHVINKIRFYDRKLLVQQQIALQKAENEIPPPPPVIKQ
jgi:hypothetical protein